MKVKELKEYFSGLGDEVEVKIYLTRMEAEIPFSDLSFLGLRDPAEVYIEVDEHRVMSLRGSEKELKLPAAIKKNLEDVNETLLYGAPILNFSKRQLAAMIIYLFKKREEGVYEKLKQIQILRRKS